MGTKVTRSSDCGNSPKQKLLEDVSVAIACADIGSLEALTLPEVVWEKVGRKPLVGLDAVVSGIRRDGSASEVTIERVVSHGRAGAVNGILSRGEKRTAFCHMFEFNSTKCTHVRSISTYAVGLR